MDARARGGDDLDAARADIARARAVTTACAPMCDATRKVLRAMTDVIDACDATAALGVARAVGDDEDDGRARDGWKVVGGGGWLERWDANAEATADAADASRIGADVVYEDATTRCARTGTRLWMSCDGLVFVTSAEVGGRGRRAARGETETATETETKDATRTRSTQWPAIPRDGDGKSASHAAAERTLAGTAAMEMIDEIATCVGRLGASEVFVVCERVGDVDAMRGTKIRDAFVTLTGVCVENVFCVESCAVDGPRSGDADTDSSGWRSSALSSPEKLFRERIADWRQRWRNERAKKLRDEKFEKMRRQAQFWGMFLRMDDASVAEERARAEETTEETPENKAVLARAHEIASMTAIHTYLKTAIEGAPRLGVPGAPEMARKHFLKHPEPERAPLMNAVYSHSLAQYASALVCAWFTPGPMGAHAAHFTNRFRICLFCACLSGHSPLDPEVVTVAIGLAAGVDKEHLDMHPVIRFTESDGEISSEDEIDGIAVDVAPDDAPKIDIDGDAVDANAEAVPNQDDAWTTLGSISSLMQDGLDRAIAESNDLKERASKMLVDFLNSGNRTARRTRRRAMKAACDAKSDALMMKKMSYDDAESLARDVFRTEFTRQATKNLTSLVFGSKFYVAVAADVTQAINASFTTYIARSSIDLFLPMVDEHEEKMKRKRAEEAAAAVAALTTKDGFIRVTLRVEDGDVVRCELTPTPLPTMVEQLLSAPKIISEKTAMLTTTTASKVSSSAEVVTTWAARTTESVRQETNRGFERAQENAQAMSMWATRTTDTVRKETNRSLELAQENAKSSFETVGAFFDRTTSSLNDAVTTGASSVVSAFSALTSNGERPTAAFDVRSLPVERILSALENEEVDRVITESNLMLKMPTDLILSKELKDVYAEIRADSSAFIKYKDDENVSRAVQRLLELVVESGDKAAMGELTRLGVLPRPKSQARIKLEQWRTQFREEKTAEEQVPSDPQTEPETQSPPSKPSVFPSELPHVPSPAQLATRFSAAFSAVPLFGGSLFGAPAERPSEQSQPTPDSSATGKAARAEPAPSNAAG